MTSISKNIYIDKLEDIFNECNNTNHYTIKMKPVDVKSNTCTDSILLEYQCIKMFLQKVTLQIGLKRFLD